MTRELSGAPDPYADGFADEPAEQLLEQAQANAQALIMATVAFVDSRGLSLEEWTDSLGETFARAWDASASWDAGDFLDAMLINFRALGATVVSAELGPDRAEALTTGFPDSALCAIFEVGVERVRQFNAVAVAIARRCGLVWEWSSDEESTRYVVSRAS